MENGISKFCKTACYLVILLLPACVQSMDEIKSYQPVYELESVGVKREPFSGCVDERMSGLLESAHANYVPNNGNGMSVLVVSEMDVIWLLAQFSDVPAGVRTQVRTFKRGDGFNTRYVDVVKDALQACGHNSTL